MVSVRELQRLGRALTAGDKTSGEVAKELGWSVADTKIRMANLASDGAVVKVKPAADAESKKRRWRNGTLPSLARDELARLARWVDGDEPETERDDAAARERAPGAGALATTSAPRRPIDPSNPYAPPQSDYQPIARPEASGGSFILGLLAGLIGGVIVFLFVLRSGKPETKRGMYWGLGIGVCLYLLSALFQMGR